MKNHLLPNLNIFSRLSLFIPFFLFCFFPFSAIFSQTCQDASVELSAVVQSTPARITLTWRLNANAMQHFIYRKFKAASTWGAVVATLPGTATEFVDSTVVKGISYEYQVFRSATGYTGYGYINAGIEIPAIEKRGVIILVVDSTFSDSLEFEINRLREDLVGDGWRVMQHNVPRTASVPSVKALIVSTYTLAPAITKAVFIIGHVPVPYSGEINVDGHGDHTGAYPADVYYADMNGTWSDVAINNITAGDPRNHNVPEDGKFDQGFIPSDLELQVGRVDFNNMPSFAASELQLLRNYLNKDHEYRKKIFTAVHRGVVDDNFGYFGNEAFAASGWKNFGPLVGHDNIKADDYFTTMTDSSYLWSYGCGGGWPQGADGIGSTANFANANLQGVFTMLFGSYFGDWESQDNFLRAPLAQGRTLTNVWSGRPHWQFHHMGLGENIGYDVRLSQNNNGIYFSNFGARVVHMAFMGDPSLRNDIIAPVSKVVASRTGNNAEISWIGSDNTVIGYNIYMKTDQMVDFVRLNNSVITGTSYTDTCLVTPGIYTYMVRALNLQLSPSGTYYNMSEGISDTVFNDQDFEVHADGNFLYNGSEVFFINASVNATHYHWIFDDGDTSNLENPVHAYQDGEWIATLIASNECNADTVYFTISTLTGIEELNTDPFLTIYPNPSDGNFTVDFSRQAADPVDLKIYKVTGELVYEHNRIIDKEIIDPGFQPDGLYIIVITGKHTQFLGKVFIRN
ncbi:MAG TPA: T9SS type A sorting domain-containing protein [Saprospiraceae bacterium]|nr:T9SS type A sorting domain-containing protein [Saprospiraceae bacterium]